MQFGNVTTAWLYIGTGDVCGWFRLLNGELLYAPAWKDGSIDEAGACSVDFDCISEFEAATCKAIGEKLQAQ